MKTFKELREQMLPTAAGTVNKPSNKPEPDKPGGTWQPPNRYNERYNTLPRPTNDPPKEANVDASKTLRDKVIKPQDHVNRNAAKDLANEIQKRAAMRKATGQKQKVTIEPDPTLQNK